MRAKCLAGATHQLKVPKWFPSSQAVQEIQQVVDRIEVSNAPLDAAAYGALLQRCGDSRAVAEGRRVYSHYLRLCSRSRKDNRVTNRFIDMLSKCGCLDEARQEFDRMQDRDAFSWNIMIGAYVQSGHNLFETLKLLWLMDLEGESPSFITFISVIRACGYLQLPDYGMKLHSRIVAEGMECHTRLATAIQSMYGRCGMLEESRRLFDLAVGRDLVGWNSMISAYAQFGHLDEVLNLFRRMALEGVKGSKSTFVSVLDTCTRKKNSAYGRVLHGCVVESGLEQDVMVATSLVNMYGKCGSFRDAKAVFQRLLWRDIIAWNAVIQACCEDGNLHEDAFELFASMDLDGYSPNESTFMSILSACSTPAAAWHGEIIHEILKSTEIVNSDFVKGALLNMYTKCGKLKEARCIFEQQVFKDLISWTSMIVAYAQNGEGPEAMLLFHRLDLEGLKPDRVTFLGALDGCSNLAEGEQLHARLLAGGGITDMQVTALVCMYAKCGSLDSARCVFEQMSMKNTSAWTAMIASCSQQQQHKEAVVVFQKMDLEGISANEVTFISVLEACADAPDLKQGRLVYERLVLSGLISVERVSNCILHMFGRCGSLQEAEVVFGQMRVKNLVSWSTLIGACTQHGHAERAIELFLLMQLDGINPDDVTFVNILSAYSHAGLVAESRDCFLSMADNYGVCFAEEHYGCILDVLGRAGRLDDAEDLISSMPFEPTGLQWMTFMGACKTHNDLGRAERVAEHVKEFFPEKTAQSRMFLFNMYAACGRFAEAEEMRAMAMETLASA